MIRGVCIPLIVSTLVLDSVCIYLLDVKAHLCRSSDAITGNNLILQKCVSLAITACIKESSAMEVIMKVANTK